MRTLKMSIVIVICFTVCWTPYYLLGLWYWFFPDHLEGKVSHSLTHILFIFGLVSACLDPIIYGLFTIRFRKGLKSCYHKAAVMSDKETNVVITDALKHTAFPSKRGVTSGEKDSDCEQAETTSTDKSCLTVFSQGDEQQLCHFSAESNIWWVKKTRSKNVIVFVELVYIYIYFTTIPKKHVEYLRQQKNSIINL